jgi:Ca-activated chloride channel family protein
LEKKNNFPEAIFNLGDAIYKQNRNEDAAKQFLLASKTLIDPKQKAQAFHNLGNAYLQDKKYEEAVNAYKQGLKLNPNDRDSKYNLAYANAKLKEKNQNQNNKNDQNKDNKQDQKDKQDNKDQKQDDQKKDGQDKKDDQGKSDQKDNKNQQQQGQQPKTIERSCRKTIASPSKRRAKNTGKNAEKTR